MDDDNTGSSMAMVLTLYRISLVVDMQFKGMNKQLLNHNKFCQQPDHKQYRKHSSRCLTVTATLPFRKPRKLP